MTESVVVVGGGVAGLTAAVAAAESGAQVQLVERSSEAESGGNTRYTEAFLRMKSLDEPADGLADSLLDDFMGHPDPGITAEALMPYGNRSALLKAHQIVDLDYVEAFVDNAGPTLRWLERQGVSFGRLPTPFPTVSTTRLAPVGGGLALVETLGRRARDLGVRFRFRSTATALCRADDGGVSGVRVRGPHGERSLVAGPVVLASGGFQGNAEMMARYHGPRALTCRPVARGGHYNKGEGIEMAIAVGAATAGNFALFHAEPVDPRSGAPEAAIFAFPYGILVNERGERFVDEARGPVDAWYERTTRDIHGQPHGLAWLILDQVSRAVANLATAIRTDQPPVIGRSLTELAKGTGIDPNALGATVRAYNDACPAPEGYDPSRPDGLSTSGVTPAKSNWARPIAEPPFEAFPIMAANVFTFGGLKTDAGARVIDRDGWAIPGLYAAGELTGLYYTNYTGSTSVLRGATFGRIAGHEAAALLGKG